ncbi:hypothetical protein FB451DRAFT_1172225 [Mycena latifolia]|nr:hypothetical protein FB451DRAFT_1172225 [Mycena latifolia]
MLTIKLSALLSFTLAAIAIAGPVARTTPGAQVASAAATVDQQNKCWDRREATMADTVDPQQRCMHNQALTSVRRSIAQTAGTSPATAGGPMRPPPLMPSMRQVDIAVLLAGFAARPPLPTRSTQSTVLCTSVVDTHWKVVEEFNMCTTC